jgi:HPt (histidine-containing phosphotransfer) domain-containing protein
MEIPIQVRELPGAWDASDSRILARFSGDRELLAEVIGMFIEDCPGMLEAMRQGLLDDNARAVRTAAHSLIGSAANFDATSVVRQARTVEAHALAEDLPAARDAFIELENEAAQLLTTLTAALART